MHRNKGGIMLDRYIQPGGRQNDFLKLIVDHLPE